MSNAGAWIDAQFIDMKTSDWRRILSVNLDAYFVLAREAANAMKETGGGVILPRFKASLQHCLVG